MLRYNVTAYDAAYVALVETSPATLLTCCRLGGVTRTWCYHRGRLTHRVSGLRDVSPSQPFFIIACTFFLCFDALHTMALGKAAMQSQVIDATTQDVIRGALRAWGMLGQSAFLQTDDEAGVFEIRDANGQLLATARRETSPIGPAWRVGINGRRERAFPSVVTALRYLRGHLCPEREAGRVLFGQGESQ